MASPARVGSEAWPINPPGMALGTFNAVMAGYHPVRARRRFDQTTNFEGPLSLKLILRGQGVWTTHSGRYVLDPGYCLVLNQGEIYSLEFDLAEPVETFCPFFAHGFAEDVAGALSAKQDALLDAPAPKKPVEFAAHIRPLDNRLIEPLRKVRRLSREEAPCRVAWDEAFGDLAEALIALKPRWAIEHANGGVRATTREEITRRINRARDFIHSNSDRQIALGDIAGAAALSPHHFHRLFRAALGCTPSAYVAELRLARAARLLSAGDLSVTEICLAVGWESLGSFSSRFKRRFGAAPLAFRKFARSEKQAALARGKMAL